MSAEVLGSPLGDGRRSRLPLLLLVLGLLVVAGVGAERWERQRQLDGLLAAAADTERVVADSRRSLSGLVQYSNQLLNRPDLPPDRRAVVLQTFALDAARYPPRVEGPRARVEAVRPLPWDDALAAAREAYLARIDAWTAFVAAAQEQPDQLLLERRATRAPREAAARALVAAADGRSADDVEAVEALLLIRR